VQFIRHHRRTRCSLCCIQWFRSSGAVPIFGLLVFVIACNRPEHVSRSALDSQWHQFQGTWTAAGNRTILRLTENRWASISTFSGSLFLAGGARPAVAFRSDAIVFRDSSTGLIGRAVWTDEHGDQAVSELRGEGTADNNKITGTFVGGTGRYSGATGGYEFSWRFVLENEDGIVEGQSIGLNGRVKVDSPQRTSAPTGPHA
jgi:hypothetical protein